MTRPDFEDLVGGEGLDARERERLERVHDLLVQAGPPPELPDSLARAPEPQAAVVVGLPRKRVRTALLLAASLAAVALGGGYFWGAHGHRAAQFQSVKDVVMHGTPAAPNALASIRIAKADASGNWPMLLKIQGLKKLPPNGYYELYLTRGGKPVASCGTFRVHSGLTQVQLNAPYSLKRFDGWVVTRHVPGRREAPQPLLTT
jgi:anti-sigma-K factor RskA